MKKFLLKISCFILIVIFIDFVFGVLCRYLNSHAKGGDTATHWTITKQQLAPLIILGSSRAIHHYKPEIFEDSLGYEVYNCGVDGNGILFNFGRLKLILERYTPQIVIYDATPWLDIDKGDNMRYLLYLKRWYNESVIDTLIYDISPLEKIKALSNLYRYNTTFIQMLSDNIKPKQEIGYNGYKALSGIINYEPKPYSREVDWDPIKEKYFNKLIEICNKNNIQLIVIYSPWFQKEDSYELNEITNLCKQKNIPLLDYYSDSVINKNPQLFVDPSHLNDTGATILSKKVSSQIKHIYDSITNKTQRVY